VARGNDHGRPRDACGNSFFVHRPVASNPWADANTTLVRPTRLATFSSLRMVRLVRREVSPCGRRPGTPRQESFNELADIATSGRQPSEDGLIGVHQRHDHYLVDGVAET
jgi:hypothetical protein